MKTIVFDVETSPLPESELAALVPLFGPAEVVVESLETPEENAAEFAEPPGFPSRHD